MRLVRRADGGVVSLPDWIDDDWRTPPIQTLPPLQIRDNGDDKRVVSEARRLYKNIPEVEGSVCLDVGGHVGLVARLLIEQGARLVYAVEPDPDSFRYLEMNTAGLNVVAMNAAVATHSGVTTLYSKESSPSCNRTTKPRRGGIETAVIAYSLGDLLRFSDASVLKMDIEGAEYGLPELLRLPKHLRVIVAEVHFGGMGQKDRARGLALMESWREQGFRLVRGSNLTEKCFNHNGVWQR